MNTKRKILRVTSVCLAVALPCLALANPPSPNTDMAVGEVEAVLAFCAKSNPGAEKEIEGWRKVLTGKVAADVRHSTEYRHGFDLISEALAQGDKASVLATCGQLAPPKKPDRDRDGDQEREHDRATGPRR